MKKCMLFMAFFLLGKIADAKYVTRPENKKTSNSQNQPLIGSNWAKEHPGELPYEECHLIVSSTDEKWSGIFASGGDTSYSTYLSCSANSLGLEYLIPIHYHEHCVEGGLYLSIIQRYKFEYRAKVTNLDQKTVGDVFGKYKGFSIGGGIYLVGGEGSFLKNSSKVKIRTQAITSLDLLSIGSSRMLISMPDDVSMLACKSRYVIINENTDSRSLEDCTANGPYDTYVSRTPVHTSIMNLRFVKIRKK